MRFVGSPFCFNGKLKTCIVDGRITEELENNLINRGIKVIKTPKCKVVYDAISYHPDIQFFNSGKGRIIVASNLYEEYVDIFNGLGLDIIKGEKSISKKYPEDIAYNVCVVGKYAIHNFRYTDEVVLREINECRYERINIKQGYAKCSICVVDDKSIITADRGIVEAIKSCKADIDCLLIQDGNIDLFNMNYGFIGGCSGLLSTKEIGFLGEIEKHPDFEEIKKFLEERGKIAISLSNEKLLDLGSIIPIEVDE